MRETVITAVKKITKLKNNKDKNDVRIFTNIQSYYYFNIKKKIKAIIIIEKNKIKTDRVNECINGTPCILYTFIMC